MIKACDGGNASECLKLGSLYDNGEGVARNKVRAITLYSKACDGGNVLGCFNLGALDSFAGQRTAQDKESAPTVYSKSCNSSVVSDCFNLAGRNFIGQGVAKDKTATASLYSNVCDGGEATGCFNVKGLYGKNGIEEGDLKQAILSIRRALTLDPNNQKLRSALDAVEEELAAQK